MFYQFWGISYIFINSKPFYHRHGSIPHCVILVMCNNLGVETTKDSHEILGKTLMKGTPVNPQAARVKCHECKGPVYDNDSTAYGCDVEDSHWWHLDCMPDEHVPLATSTKEKWVCPACQPRLDRLCNVCFKHEYTTSDCDKFIVCISCQQNTCKEHLTPDRLLRVGFSNTWVCDNCVEL